jgi:hypothetical protein
MRTQTVYLVGTILKTVEGIRYSIGRVTDRDMSKMPDIARNNGYVMIASDKPEAGKIPEAKIFPQSGKMFAPFTKAATYNEYFGGKQEKPEMSNAAAMAFDSDSNAWYPCVIKSASPDGSVITISWQSGGTEISLPREYVKMNEEKQKQPAKTAVGRYSIYVLAEMHYGRQPLPFKAWQLIDDSTVAIMPPNAKGETMPKLAFNVGDLVQVRYQGVDYPATISDAISVSVDWADGSGNYLAPLNDVTFGAGNVADSPRRGRLPAVPVPKAPARPTAPQPRRFAVGDEIDFVSPSDGVKYVGKILEIKGANINIEFTGEWSGQDYGEWITVKDVIGSAAVTPKTSPKAQLRAAAPRAAVPRAAAPAATPAPRNLNTGMPEGTVMVQGKPVMLARADGSQFFVTELTPQSIKARKSAGPGRPVYWDIRAVKKRNAHLYEEITG